MSSELLEPWAIWYLVSPPAICLDHSAQFAGHNGVIVAVREACVGLCKSILSLALVKCREHDAVKESKRSQRVKWARKVYIAHHLIFFSPRLATAAYDMLDKSFEPIEKSVELQLIGFKFQLDWKVLISNFQCRERVLGWSAVSISQGTVAVWLFLIVVQEYFEMFEKKYEGEIF